MLDSSVDIPKISPPLPAATVPTCWEVSQVFKMILTLLQQLSPWSLPILFVPLTSRRWQRQQRWVGVLLGFQCIKRMANVVGTAVQNKRHREKRNKTAHFISVLNLPVLTPCFPPGSACNRRHYSKTLYSPQWRQCLPLFCTCNRSCRKLVDCRHQHPGSLTAGS